MWYFGLLIPSVFLPALGISPECRSYLMDVASSNSDFQVCALLWARPFSVCTKCDRNYATAYNMFVKLKDGRGPVEKNCSEDLVSGDRVSIINRDFEHLTTTWNEANCESCLVRTEHERVVSFEIADSTLEFQRLAREMNRCIDTQLQNKSLICDVCLNHFRNLSDFYDGLSVKYSGRMCMDILDTMNETRVEWSTYGCTKIYTLGYEVWMCTVGMIAVTLAFYTVTKYSQNPRDSAIIEGRTLRDRMSRIFENDRTNVGTLSDSQEVPPLRPNGR